MLELWGADDCEACIIAKNFMGKTPLEWKYVDVASIKFTGFIPRLILEDGTYVEDFPAIKQYVTNLMKKMGLEMI